MCNTKQEDYESLEKHMLEMHPVDTEGFFLGQAPTNQAVVLPPAFATTSASATQVYAHNTYEQYRSVKANPIQTAGSSMSPIEPTSVTPKQTTAKRLYESDSSAEQPAAKVTKTNELYESDSSAEQPAAKVTKKNEDPDVTTQQGTKTELGPASHREESK
eukprot:Platyproteum_vivax@DN7591_c3_g2_i5.p1